MMNKDKNLIYLTILILAFLALCLISIVKEQELQKAKDKHYYFDLPYIP